MKVSFGENQKLKAIPVHKFSLFLQKIKFFGAQRGAFHIKNAAWGQLPPCPPGNALDNFTNFNSIFELLSPNGSERNEDETMMSKYTF